VTTQYSELRVTGRIAAVVAAPRVAHQRLGVVASAAQTSTAVQQNARQAPDKIEAVFALLAEHDQRLRFARRECSKTTCSVHGLRTSQVNRLNLPSKRMAF
jgi:hypothetical protein